MNNEAFELMATQLQAGSSVCERAIIGKDHSKMSAMHLLGIASYVKELAQRVLDDIERGKL